MILTSPKSAKKNDKIYIISPSAGLMPLVSSRVERARKNIETMGFKVVIAEHAGLNAGYVSASIEDRVADIHAAFLDKECTIIMAAIGGNHSNQLLPYLDFEIIKNNPKIFIGYSDNTVLHLAFATQANLQTFYGPCFLTQFGEFPEVLPYTIEHFVSTAIDPVDKSIITASNTYTDEVLDWFSKQDETRPRTLIENSQYEWWKAGVAIGHALPVTIPSINHLLGTKYMPETKGSILMIDIPEGHNMYEGLSISEFDAWLTDLDNVGILADISGIVIARPYRYTVEMIAQLKEVVLRILKSYSYPILFNVDFGHTDPMITIPYFATIKLDSEKDFLVLTKNNEQ